MPIALLCLGVVLLMVGSFLLIRGVRGRRTDEHPICRRCGFDLFGRPGGVTRCSECGADVSRPRAIRIGHRRRRPVVAALGLLVMSPTIFAAGLVGWFLINHVNWIEKVPLWYLAHEARSTVATERDPALRELIRRMTAAQMGSGDVKRITDDVLAIQADPNRAWSPLQGDLIETAWSLKLLSAKDHSRYYANGPQFALVTRPRVRRGDDLPVRIVQTGARYGSAGPIWIFLRIGLDDQSDLVAPFEDFKERFNGGYLTPRSPGVTISQRFKLDPARVAAAKDGRKTLRLILQLEVATNAPGGMRTVAYKPIPLRATWELVPASTVTVRAVPDPAALPAVESHAKATVWADGPRSRRAVTVLVSVPNSPHPLAHRVILRDRAGREWPIDGISLPPGHSAVARTVSRVIPDFIPEDVDVVLRPDAKTALDSVDVHEYWAGEPVIPGVPVQYRSLR